MKLLRLDLIAFGPFTDRSLAFSEHPGTLQIVLGENEAGKSTSLRALEGLLFGIDPRSPDAHTHPYGELRVGGILADQRGEILDIVRRKGLKGTLRDRAGEPVDEAHLKKMLHGVDADAFRALYGLNHETLRLGADALEKAQGKVGESLFDAGLGGLGVGQAIAELAEEADELFTPQARKKPLNEAIRALVETQKEVRTEATNPEAFLKQERGIEEARSDAREAEVERRALLVEQGRLRRIVRVGPGLAKRRSLLEARAALGEVVILSEVAASDRERALSDRAEAQAKLSRIESEIVRLSEASAAIDVPRALLDAADEIDALKERASMARAAIEERPGLARDLEDADRRLSSVAARVGACVTAPPDGNLSARVGQLALERETSGQRMRELSARVRELEAEKARLGAELLRLPHRLDLTELAASVDEAAGVALLPGQMLREEAEIEVLRVKLDSEIATLGLFAGTAAELARSKVPPIEQVIAFERDRRERVERARACTANLVAAERKARERVRDIDALLRSGAVPTEAELSSVRATRDALLARLSSGQQAGADAFETLDQCVRDADSVADRLRREASRVERHTQLVLALDEANATVDDLRRELASLGELEVAEGQRWGDAWRGAEIEPLAPTEMRGWLERRRAIVDLWLEREARTERLGVSRARIAEVTETLEHALLGHGVLAAEELPPSSRATRRDDGLSSMLASGRATLTSNERGIVKREALELQLAEVDAKLVRLDADRTELSVVLEASSGAWSLAMVSLGLEGSATAAEASARASDLATLARAEEDVSRIRAALARLDGRDAELQAQLDPVMKRCEEVLGGTLAELEPVARVLAITKRLAEARQGELSRATFSSRIADLSASGIDERGRLARVEAKMAELERAAGVSEGELPLAEGRSLEAVRLDREIERVEQELRVHTAGATFAELEDELVALSATDVSLRLDELAEQIETSESRRDRAHHSIGGLEEGFRKLEREAKAADLASLAESHLARALTLLRRYAVARLAKEVLEREVERYRESHQGPILRRAEELYRRLTLGRYEALRVVYGEDERPELRCVRGGQEIEIKGLSDGTRDQLFLALRLATLERHAAEGEPMPLVLDDVFVHFDDDRTRAGLEVLAELSGVVQVLLFTHHARVVELAEREPRIAFASNRL